MNIIRTCPVARGCRGARRRRGSARRAADTLNVYSIWPENWAKPMFEEFEKATGIKVNFVRFSLGRGARPRHGREEQPARGRAVRRPVETFAAGMATNGLFEPYKPPSFAKLPARMKQADGQWVAIADDPLVFMTNDKFRKEHNLKAPASWDDLLEPAYKNMLQMARRADVGHGGDAHLLDPRGKRSRRDQGVRLHEEAPAQRAALHQERGGGTLPVGLGQAGGGIFFIVDALDTKAKGYDVTISFPKEGIGHGGGRHRAHQGRQGSRAGKKLIDWATSPAMQTSSPSTRSTSCRRIPTWR